jgi:hypothetical protein
LDKNCPFSENQETPLRDRIINILAFAVLAALWLGFAAALLFNPGLLDTVWQSFRSWSLIPQIVVGLLALPVVAGLWIWETPWPLLLRAILVAGLALATIYTFFPKKPTRQTRFTPVKP